MRIFLHLFLFLLIVAVLPSNSLIAQTENAGGETEITYNYEDIEAELDYVGIGVVVQREREYPWLPVRKVLDNGPAHEAGMEQGDSIVKIDGVPVVKKTIDEIAQLLVGEVNTTVTIEYMRNHRFHTVSIARQPISF